MRMLPLSTQDLADEAARRGRSVTRQYIGYLIESDKIAAVKVGGQWIIEREEAERWLAEWLADQDKE